jgi:hypothetical protein
MLLVLSSDVALLSVYRLSDVALSLVCRSYGVALLSVYRF